MRPSFSNPSVILALLILGILTGCDAILDPADERLSEMTSTWIAYQGMDTENGVAYARFTLTNDSTENISYFAYSENELHYSTEMLSDTGWVYLFWNWCGTGAEYLPLEHGAQVDFKTGLPASSCTWRVVLNITGEEQDWWQTLRSDPVVFVKP